MSYPGPIYGPMPVQMGTISVPGGSPSFQDLNDPRTIPPINFPSFTPTTAIYRPVGPVGMAVYDQADPSHPYQVKMFDSDGSGRTDASSVMQYLKGSNTATMAMPAFQYAGSLTSLQDSTSYRIPVGPEIDSIRLGVSPWDHSPQGNLPVFDDIVLYDANGQKLAEMNPHLDGGHVPSASLLVSLANAPEGSQLVLRISALAAASLNQSSLKGQGIAGTSHNFDDSYSSNSQTDDGSTSFILTIQEYEKLISGNQGSSGLDGNTEVSTDLGSSYGSYIRGSDLNSASSQSEIDSEGETTVTGSTTSTPAATLNVRIPTGPLISRGATPVGGILATAVTEDDPTPAIERYDGILTAFLGGLNSEDDLLTDEERLTELGVGSSRDIATEEMKENLDLVGTTPGNFPLVAVQPTGISDPAQSAAFLASLPSLNTESPATEPIAEQLDLALLPVEPTKESAMSRRVASWASAAFGLTLGLTLTSGTYLPNLLDRVRKSAARKSRQRVRQANNQPHPHL